MSVLKVNDNKNRNFILGSVEVVVDHSVVEDTTAIGVATVVSFNVAVAAGIGVVVITVDVTGGYLKTSCL